VTINYSTVQTGSSAGTFEPNPNHENGVGDNTLITFSEINPQIQVAKDQNSRAESKGQPDFIILGQEMSHALAQMDGAMIPESKGTKVNTYISSTGERVTEHASYEELTAHGIGSYGTRYSNTKSY
ncbi:MAG TPA: hypothetical protein PLS00_17840, partial [Niabella sp.]|nr:hypothetical protein [Niabella sp.]